MFQEKNYFGITAKIKYNQSDGVATWVYVDEMHELWGDEYSIHALEKMWREVRKRGGICSGTTCLCQWCGPRNGTDPDDMNYEILAKKQDILSRTRKEWLLCVS